MSASADLLDKFLNHAKALPPAPRILPDLLSLLRQEDVDSERVVRLIMFDPALTIRVLQLANSAVFAGTQPVQDLQTGVARLGFDQIYEIVASAVGERTLGGEQPGYGLAAGELWRHCAVTAVAGRVIAQSRGADENLAFTACLLHDLGKLILSTALETQYAEVMRLIGEGQLSFIEAEKKIFNVDHAELGGRLLQRWKFPDTLAQPVRHHHTPDKAGPHMLLASIAHAADLIARLLGHGYGHQAYAVRTNSKAMALLGLRENELDRLVSEVQNALEEFTLVELH